MLFGLFETKTFTDLWIRRQNLKLVFEFDKSDLNAVRLGDNVDLLSFLGTAESPKAVKKEQILYYFSLGLAIGFDSNSHKISDFRFVWLDYLSEGFTPFAGALVINGQSIDGAGLAKEQVIRYWGQPYYIDRDEDEEVLFYKNGQWQFEFTLDGILKHLIVTNELISKEELKIFSGLKL